MKVFLQAWPGPYKAHAKRNWEDRKSHPKLGQASQDELDDLRDVPFGSCGTFGFSATLLIFNLHDKRIRFYAISDAIILHIFFNLRHNSSFASLFDPWLSSSLSIEDSFSHTFLLDQISVVSCRFSTMKINSHSSFDFSM